MYKFSFFIIQFVYFSQRIQCEVAKCCPIGQSYDRVGRFCAKNADFHSHFVKLFGNIIPYENIIPDCSEDEVFVEYFSTVHNIQFDGRNLKVDGKTLLPNKFCIEDLLNIKSGEANNDDEYIIVRSCRPRFICEKIPCIRRCCKADQIMLPQPKGKRECQYHPNRTNLMPVFYNISLPLSSDQKEINLKGRIFLCFIYLNSEMVQNYDLLFYIRIKTSR